jgi:hypothetical protein
MEFEREILEETLVLGLLLGVGSAFVVLVGLSRLHWVYRVAFPIAVAWLLLPTKAYPACSYFLLISGETLLVISLANWWRRRRDATESTDVRSTFTLRSLLAATGLIAAVFGFGVIAAEGSDDFAWFLGSSVASSAMLLVGTWCCLTQANYRVRITVVLVVLIASTVVWEITIWFDDLDWYSGHFFVLLGHTVSTSLVLCDALFGLVLLSCTVVMLTAFHDKAFCSSRTIRLMRWIAGPLIIVASSLGGFFYYQLAKPPPLIPIADLPNPNGHSYFAQAGELVRSVRVPDKGTDSTDSIVQFVRDNRETLSLVRQGLELECQIEIEWEDSWEYFSDALDANRDVYQIARLQRLEAYMYADSGSYGRAARSCVDNIRFAHASSRGGLVTDLITTSVVESMGAKELVRIIPHLDALSCRSAALELAQVDSTRHPVDEFIEREELWDQVTYGWISRFLVAMDTLISRSSDLNSSLYELEQRDNVIRRLLIVELALRAFKLEHESTPQHLDELVPEYLTQLPIDPYGGGTFRYRRNEATATAYSLGPDLDDDQGEAMTWNELLAEDNGDVTLSGQFDSRASANNP